MLVRGWRNYVLNACVVVKWAAQRWSAPCKQGIVWLLPAIWIGDTRVVEPMGYDRTCGHGVDRYRVPKGTRNIYLSICLSIYLSIYLSVCLCVCLSVCLSIGKTEGLVLVNQPFFLLFIRQNGYALRSSKLKQRNNNNNPKKCLICIHTDTLTTIQRQSMAMFTHSYNSMPTGVSDKPSNPDVFFPT